MSSSSSPSLSVVVTTYERPSALDVVLRALDDQEDDAFEIVVADDGSGRETASVVAAWRKRLGGRIEHAWQDDRGRRKARALNLAVLASAGDYLVFLDGDCIPRPSFVTVVRRSMVAGVFLAGKRVDLNPRATRQVLVDRSPLWRRSALRLIAGGAVQRRRAGSLLQGRDRRRAWQPGSRDFFPPYAAYGFLVGMSRGEFEKVNGLDMRYVGWGEEDVDLAVRLRNLGLRCGWPGPRSTLLHLPHASAKGGAPSNALLLAEARASGRVEALEGLRELAGGLSAGAA